MFISQNLEVPLGFEAVGEGQAGNVQALQGITLWLVLALAFRPRAEPTRRGRKACT